MKATDLREGDTFCVPPRAGPPIWYVLKARSKPRHYVGSIEAPSYVVDVETERLARDGSKYMEPMTMLLTCNAEVVVKVP